MLSILNNVLRVLGILGCIVSCYIWFDAFRISCHTMEILVRGNTKDSNDN